MARSNCAVRVGAVFLLTGIFGVPLEHIYTKFVVVNRDGIITAENFPAWSSDELGEDFQQSTLPLGEDPDGEGEIFGTLIKHLPPVSSSHAHGSILYLHGYNDYFFHQELAEHLSERGWRFYALDLRKCGRSRREGQTPHFCSDFHFYDQDIDAALQALHSDLAGSAYSAMPTIVIGHSTGGLIAPFSLNRLLRQPSSLAHQMVHGLVLNSPFIDLPTPAVLRGVATFLAETVGKYAPLASLPQSSLGAYGESLHADFRGEWTYNLQRKPLIGPPLRLGWVRAVTRAQRSLRNGCVLGIPTLMLFSECSALSSSDSEKIDTCDAVLDVAHIQRAKSYFTPEAAMHPITHARHDVFLSRTTARSSAYSALDTWLGAFEDTVH